MRALTTRKLRLFAVVWMLITTAVFALSGLLFHFPGAFPPNNGEAFNSDGVSGALVNGLPNGILVGISQMLVLPMVGIRSWRWAAGTAVALWLIHTIGDVLPDSIAVPAMVLLGGLLLAGLQWWAIGWPPKRGLPWLLATAVSWSLGIWLGLQLAGGSDWRTAHVLAGLVTGLLYGLATGALWLWMHAGSNELAEAAEGE
ncbi:hypothetical protein [Pseudarthrobacter siccitolerans]